MRRIIQSFVLLFLFITLLIAVPAVAKNELRKDGRFIAYDDGTVLDTQTKLMWASTDNGTDIDQQSAKRYCEGYRGAGYKDWRLPTLNELATLCDDIEEAQQSDCRGIHGSILDVYVTPLIKLSCVDVWASDMRGSEGMQILFNYCHRTGTPPSRSGFSRALPVRSVK